MAELELVSDCRQMERGREGFYQTHMNVGGGLPFMFPKMAALTHRQKKNAN